jgi:hypothetical protein
MCDQLQHIVCWVNVDPRLPLRRWVLWGEWIVPVMPGESFLPRRLDLSFELWSDE